MSEEIVHVGQFDHRFNTSKNHDHMWFWNSGSFSFHPSSGPNVTLGPEFFMVGLNKTNFIFFDGRTFDYNTDKQRSSCAICWARKKIDVAPEDFVQIPFVEMPYGHQPYDDVIEKFKSSESYGPRIVWDSICPECLSIVEAISDSISTEDIVSRSI